MVVAPMLAPVLSGLIVAAVGWRGIFALVALGAAALALWSRAALPETAPRGAPESLHTTLGGFAEVARSGSFWGHACFGAASLASFLFFVGAAPYVMQEAYGAGPAVYGLYFIPLAATYMVSNIACGRLTARHGPRRMIVVGSGLALGAGAAGLAVMGLGAAHPLALFVPAVFHSVGAGLAVPNAVAGAVGAAPARAGAASGLFGFVQFMTAAASTQIAGLLPHDVAAPTLAGMMVLTGVGLAGYLALARAGGAAPAART
jgi:DHA1 family bicyclomycin/chloramphenicol resistance-like MFS transporter